MATKLSKTRDERPGKVTAPTRPARHRGRRLRQVDDRRGRAGAVSPKAATCGETTARCRSFGWRVRRKSSATRPGATVMLGRSRSPPGAGATPTAKTPADAGCRSDPRSIPCRIGVRHAGKPALSQLIPASAHACATGRNFQPCIPRSCWNGAGRFEGMVPGGGIEQSYKLFQHTPGLIENRSFCNAHASRSVLQAPAHS